MLDTNWTAELCRISIFLIRFQCTESCRDTGLNGHIAHNPVSAVRVLRACFTLQDAGDAKYSPYYSFLVDMIAWLR
jgi:hypothetical protein